MPEEVLLSARGLAFEAGGARLIDGIDLDIRAGARVAVMGANGAGKSLLLRLLHGLIAPGGGEVGRACSGAPRLRAASRVSSSISSGVLMTVASPWMRTPLMSCIVVPLSSERLTFGLRWALSTFCVRSRQPM